MKKPGYSEPAIGWNDEDFQTGLVKFGVAEYAAPTAKTIAAPTRPAITYEPDHEADALEEGAELLPLM